MPCHSWKNIKHLFIRVATHLFSKILKQCGTSVYIINNHNRNQYTKFFSPVLLRNQRTLRHHLHQLLRFVQKGLFLRKRESNRTHPFYPSGGPSATVSGYCGPSDTSEFPSGTSVELRRIFELKNQFHVLRKISNSSVNRKRTVLKSRLS